MTPTNWRKSFDERFRMEDAAREGKGVGHSLGAEIKSFITSLLVSLKDEVGKEKMSMTPDYSDKPNPTSWKREHLKQARGFNSALTKVEDIISKAIKG